MKERYSISCPPETMALVDQAAERNNISRSAVIRMFLDLIRYIPVEKLRETSPVPGYLGLSNKEVANNERN